MRFHGLRFAVLLAALWLGACASRPLPKYEKPIARTAVQSVRTTAYTHTESDHLQHGRRTALGTRLRNGPIHSAAADWSRWPAGTLFRIRETGELFEVDDYGWALAGTNTIDLYKPTRRAMNAWGVRRVTIENLRWGEPSRSLAVLRGRSGHRHVKRMIRGFAQNSQGFPQLAHDLTPLTPPPTQRSVQLARAQPVAARPTESGTQVSRVTKPFYSTPSGGFTPARVLR